MSILLGGVVGTWTVVQEGMLDYGLKDFPWKGLEGWSHDMSLVWRTLCRLLRRIARWFELYCCRCSLVPRESSGQSVERPGGCHIGSETTRVGAFRILHIRGYLVKDYIE